MRIVHLASEFAPLAKAGGLGEVVAGLSKELTLLGEEVEVIIPKYDFIDVRKLFGIKMEVPDFKSLENGNQHANAMWAARYEQVHIHFLEARHPSGYFHRNKIYGCDDDIARFIYFSRAAIQYLKLRGQPIDILHLHDWHVSLAAVLARDVFKLPIKAIFLTIHNAEYQGKCATWDLDAIGLNGTDYLTKEKLKNDDPAQPKLINLLKGGVVYSDAVTTVSRSYAQEILTSEMGYHLDPTFRKYKAKITGILNGLDLSSWNPGYDSGDSMDAILKAKEKYREKIKSQFLLNKNHRPWIGAITRLVTQKGPELLQEAVHQTLKLGGTFLLLGSSPVPEIQESFNQLKAQYAESKQALLHFDYDEALSRSLYAALDFLIIPSLYEPCGLTQMIAMHYGTIPIARATGGLKDTIFDCENIRIEAKKKNGFLFHNFTTTSMTQTLERAVQTFKTNPSLIQLLIRNGMGTDWSWKNPAQEYLNLYQKLYTPSG